MLGGWLKRSSDHMVDGTGIVAILPAVGISSPGLPEMGTPVRFYVKKIYGPITMSLEWGRKHSSMWGLMSCKSGLWLVNSTLLGDRPVKKNWHTEQLLKLERGFRIDWFMRSRTFTLSRFKKKKNKVNGVPMRRIVMNFGSAGMDAILPSAGRLTGTDLWVPPVLLPRTVACRIKQIDNHLLVFVPLLLS